jgi:hypothetical protein
MKSSKVEQNRPKRQKTGGRTKGTPNKRTLALMEICDEKGYDLLSQVITDLQLLNDPKDRLHFNLKFMEFLYPKRRAVDENGNPDDGPTFEVMRFGKKESVVMGMKRGK